MYLLSSKASIMRFASRLDDDTETTHGRVVVVVGISSGEPFASNTTHAPSHVM